VKGAHGAMCNAGVKNGTQASLYKRTIVVDSLNCMQLYHIYFYASLICSIYFYTGLICFTSVSTCCSCQLAKNAADKALCLDSAYPRHMCMHTAT